MGSAGALRVGCSGWQYKHWRGDFYPTGVPQTRWFQHYASVFDTVEINNTFYRLPEAETFERWGSRAPAGFLYAVKASRFLTHMKKLKEPEEPLDRLLSRVRALGRHLGPILYQLPPRWQVDLARLESFLRALPNRVQHTIEFRDPSWYRREVYDLLDRFGVALCLHDMPESATGRMRRGPFLYVRFHGTSAKYNGAYTDEQLQGWAEWLGEHRARGVDLYAYFNNDTGGHAPRNALTLRRLLTETSAGRQHLRHRHAS
jgi:uncharacterized protein YecE (DUF72 family)